MKTLSTPLRPVGVLAGVLAGFLGGFLAVNPALAGPAATPAAGAAAEAETNAASADTGGGSELAALVRELRRSRDQLALEDAPSAYEAVLRFVRAEALTLDGSYGGVLSDIEERQAFGRLELPVGTLAHDDSAFFGGASPSMVSLPLKPDALATTRALWRAADLAYRTAVAVFRAKESSLRQLAEKRDADDRSAPPPVRIQLAWAEGDTYVDAPLDAAEFDREGLRALAAELSAIFATHPRIDNGDVFIQVLRSWETTVDARGSAWGQMRDRAYLAVVSDARAEDGMHLDHADVIHLQALPTAAELRGPGRAMVERVLAELEAMLDAPMIEEDYDGPVLFSAEASAQLLASTVAVHANGTPAPLSEWGRVQELEPYWLERLGKPVMPAWLSIVDDPLAEGFGHYAVDAEGVAAQRVELVQKGVLGDMLMTRQPNEKISTSNGHARTSFELSPSAAISNLRVTSTRRGLTQQRLEAELLRRAREDGYDYAYVVESLRDGGILGSPPRDSAQLFGSGRKVPLAAPAIVYRIDAKGTRTLVRGALLAPVSMRALRRIREVGREVLAVALRIPAGISGGFSVDLGAEALLTQTVDVQVETPAMLIDGFELVVERGEHERLPFLVHPLRREAIPAVGVEGDAAASGGATPSATPPG